MKAITDKRPRKAALLLERTADAPLPPVEMYTALLAVITADLGDAPHFVLARERLIVVQSAPWCRAEYRVSRRSEGSTVRHSLLDVGRLRWLRALSTPRAVAAAPADFDRLMARAR